MIEAQTRQGLQDNENYMSKPTNNGYILVVGHCPRIHTLLDIMLRPLSLEIRRVANGGHALAVIANDSPFYSPSKPAINPLKNTFGV